MLLSNKKHTPDIDHIADKKKDHSYVWHFCIYEKSRDIFSYLYSYFGPELLVQ